MLFKTSNKAEKNCTLQEKTSFRQVSGFISDLDILLAIEKHFGHAYID